MAEQPKAYKTAAPIFSLGFIASRAIVVGAGGGSSRTGVRNRLTLYKIDLSSRTLEKVDEYELPADEDAPMSMAVELESKQLVCGINTDEAKMSRGENDNLRVFSFTDDRLNFESSQRSIESTKPDDYQKVAAFSHNGKLLAVGNTSGQFTLYNFPALNKVFADVYYDEQEIYDVDFNDTDDLVLACSSKQLMFWSTQAVEKATPKQAIENPSFKKDLVCTFRSAKFGRGASSKFFYTVVNASPKPGAKKSSPSERKSFVSQWDVKTWKLVKTRSISQRPLTAFEVSHNGKMLAFGSSDLSVGVVDAETLQPILTVLRAHDFPATTLRWSPDDELVVSGSADATIRVLTLQGSPASTSQQRYLWPLLIVLSILAAVLLQALITHHRLPLPTLHF